MATGFQQTLDQLRAHARSEADKGALFERLMKRYFARIPFMPTSSLRSRSGPSGGALAPGFDAADTGIDLVAEDALGRMLRHPVQVLRPWHPYLEG